MAYSVDTASRVTGLASGIDTDSMVKELMAAERLPLDKMEQDVSWTTWQRDSYRDMNKLFYDLDQQTLDMKLQKTYQTKEATSTQSDAISATATANAENGTYSMQVTQLATSAINVTADTVTKVGAEKINPFTALSGQMEKLNAGAPALPTTIKFTTYQNSAVGEEHAIEITANDSLDDILTKITDQDNGVRAFYDVQTDKVIMERTSVGKYNPDEVGAEIDFSSDASGFFQNVLGMDNINEKGGTDAEFIYNDAVTLSSKTNSTTLNGITYNFTNTMDKAANITINNDIDASYDKIMKFIESYNTAIETVNDSLQESRYRDYKPLTETQKAELSETEIEQWEEKSKSGLLKGDRILSGGLSSMRSSWYGTVDNSSSFNSITDIGIKTSSDYLERGKLEVNEDELKAALREDPDSVHKLFSNDVKGSGRGIMNRLEDSMEKTIKNVEVRAGKPTSTDQQYTLGRQLEDMADRISAFEDRLRSTEDRYWKQFAAMESMIQQMNSQSSYLSQQFSY